MSNYLIYCFDNDNRIEQKTLSKKTANRIYQNAVKSGKYSSVTLRREEKTHGYAIKSWSKNDGEVLLL